MTSDYDLYQKYNKAYQKIQREVAENRKTPHVFKGLDLKEELKKFSRLPVFPKETRKPITLKVRHSYSYGAGCSGRASVERRRITVTLGARAPVEDVLELLLHELIHISLPDDVHHGERFVLRLAVAAKQKWGIEIAKPLSIERGAHKNRAYALDYVIRKALKEQFAKVAASATPEPPVPSSAPESSPAQAPAPAVSKVVRMEVLVAKRAAHAAAMLEAHESKLRRERKIVQKWRAKVRYYEKAVAARSREA